MKIPNSAQSKQILRSHNKAKNVFLHCQAVAKIAEKVCKKLEKKGVKVNTKLTVAGAWLHDICRAREHTNNAKHLKESIADHAEAGYKVVKKLGYPYVAKLVRVHSLILHNPKRLPKTIEEKIVFYADKRCIENKIVSVEKRVKDISRRYKISVEKELEYVKAIEHELVNFRK